MAGQLPLLSAIQQLMNEVMSGPGGGEDRQGPLATERKLLAQAKKMGLFAAGVASQKYMMSLADQQEVMGALADAIMEVYAMESCILRAEKMGAPEQALRLTRFTRPGRWIEWNRPRAR